MRVGELGLEPHGLLVARDRLVGLLGVLEQHAEVVPCECARRVVTYRVPVVSLGARQVAVAVEEPAEVDAGRHVGRVEVERVVIGGARLERRAVLDLHGEIAPLFRAEAR